MLPIGSEIMPQQLEPVLRDHARPIIPNQFRCKVAISSRRPVPCLTAMHFQSPILKRRHRTRTKSLRPERTLVSGQPLHKLMRTARIIRAGRAVETKRRNFWETTGSCGRWDDAGSEVTPATSNSRKLYQLARRTSRRGAARIQRPRGSAAAAAKKTR